jgi:hypothetical protein
MNRRALSALALVAVNLAACCCGMPAQQQAAKPNAIAEDAKPPPEEKPPVAGKPVQIEPRADDTPEPVFVFKKKSRRQVDQVLSSTISTFVDKVKVDLIGCDIETTDPSNHRLVIKIHIYNEGIATLKYKPWRVATDALMIPGAKDEHGKTFSRVSSNLTGKASPSLVTIPPKKSIDDAIAFQVPPSTSEEIDFKLPGKNLDIPGFFALKISRAIFAQKEDDERDKLEEDRQRAAFKVGREAAARRIDAEEAGKRDRLVREIRDDFLSNYTTAERKYRDKNVELAGTVHEASWYPDKKEGLFVILNTKTDRVIIVAEFDRKHSAKVLALKIGQAVTVGGKMKMSRGGIDDLHREVYIRVDPAFIVDR